MIIDHATLFACFPDGARATRLVLTAEMISWQWTDREGIEHTYEAGLSLLGDSGAFISAMRRYLLRDG